MCWSKGDLATGLSSEGVFTRSPVPPARALRGQAWGRQWPQVAPGPAVCSCAGLLRALSKGALARGRGRHGGQRPRCPLWQPGPGALKGHKGPMRHGVGPASSSEGHTGQESQHSTLAQPDRLAGGAGPPTSQTGRGRGGGAVSRARRAQGSRAADRQMARPPQVDFLK